MNNTEVGHIGASPPSYVRAKWGRVAVYNPYSVLGERIKRYPLTIRLLLENALRRGADERTINSLVNWKENIGRPMEVWPSRVILQDATGVPVMVDMAALRDELQAKGKDPLVINPTIPVALVIDHSVAVDYFGSFDALSMNMALEIKRNAERYSLLKWAQGAFRNLTVVPPGKGIIHQINMEFLSDIIMLKDTENGPVAFPEMLLGTDSHTSMASSLGYLAWGVGGLEAEEVMLGGPYPTTIPPVVGVKLKGSLKGWASATDLALLVTQQLRREGLVGSIVEFFGPALLDLPVTDRAALSNMAPEYGSTTAIFPIDGQTISFLRLIGKDERHVDLVEQYAKETGLMELDESEVEYSKVIEIDVSGVEPSVAGPSRPDQRLSLKMVKSCFSGAVKKGGLEDGFVALAAITSFTNTSNPWLMVSAALLAKEAVKRGLTVKPWVKTSFAPGSPAVLLYLKRAGLIPYLEALRFHVTGLGCTACIGNSGPLLPEAEKAIGDGVKGVSVISGNRNFPNRIHRLIEHNFIASPALVIAYAIAGTVNVDVTSEPLANDPNGRPVYLKDIMPSREEVNRVVSGNVRREDYIEAYASVTKGEERWASLLSDHALLFPWREDSTFIRKPPIHIPEGPRDIAGARALLFLGDDVNTDMISPAGEISTDSPAGQYLISRGVRPKELGTYLSRRGNYEVMVRGTFAHPALRNKLVLDKRGPWTLHLPDRKLMGVFEAAQAYSAEGVPLVIIAGERYGAGRSRDWAAKGPAMLGVRAVMAASFERIHRSNLISVGILPIEVKKEDEESLTGEEVFSVNFLDGIVPGSDVLVTANGGGRQFSFRAKSRLDTWSEVERYVAGGILPLILKRYSEGGLRY